MKVYIPKFVVLDDVVAMADMNEGVKDWLEAYLNISPSVYDTKAVAEKALQQWAIDEIAALNDGASADEVYKVEELTLTYDGKTYTWTHPNSDPEFDNVFALGKIYEVEVGTD